MGDLKQLRTTRNIEYSIKEFLESELEFADWSNVTVIFRNQRDTKTSLPHIAIKVGNTTHNRVEFSSSSTYRTFPIILDFYCRSDSQRADLKDTVISFIKAGFPFNQYENHYDDTTNSVVVCSHNKGNVLVNTLDDEEIDLNVPKGQLSEADRYRHRITLNCVLGIVELKGDPSA